MNITIGICFDFRNILHVCMGFCKRIWANLITLCTFKIRNYNNNFSIFRLFTHWKSLFAVVHMTYAVCACTCVVWFTERDNHLRFWMPGKMCSLPVIKHFEIVIIEFIIGRVRYGVNKLFMFCFAALWILWTCIEEGILSDFVWFKDNKRINWRSCTHYSSTNNSTHLNAYEIYLLCLCYTYTYYACARLSICLFFFVQHF